LIAATSGAENTYKTDEACGLIHIFTKQFSTYAIGYISEQYTVTFDVNGGDALFPASAPTGTDGKLSTLPKPTRDGCTFLG